VTERSIVVKLKADISDLKAKLSTAKSEISSVAQTSEQSSKKTSAATLAVGDAEKIRAGARKASLAQEIRGQEQAAAAAQKYGKATAFVTGHSSDISTLGSGFLKMGVAAAAGVGVSVAAFANFDEAVSHVSATGADARANMDALRKAAIEAGADTKYSATEAAAGEEALLKAGLAAKDVLGGGLTGALNLAAAGNLNVADSAETVANTLNQFHESGSQATHVADLLAQGAGTASGEVSDMAQALGNSGVAASTFGVSLDQTVESLALLGKNGIIGAEAGTQLRGVFQTLYAPMGTAQKELDKLNFTAYDAAGKAKPAAQVYQELQQKLAALPTDAARASASQRIFGEQIQAGTILTKAGASGMADISTQFGKFGTAADQAAARMDNLKGDFEQLKGSIDTDLIQSGSGANAFLRDFTQGATDAANSFGKLPTGVQQGALGVASFVAVAGLGVGAFSKLAVGASETKTALKNLEGTGAGSALTKVGVAAGVALVAVTALDVAGTALHKTYGTADTTLGDAGQAITGLSSAVDGATPSLDKFFSLKIDQGLGPAQDQITGLADAFQYLNKDTGATGFFDSFTSKIPGVTSGAEQVNARFAQLDQVLSTTAQSSAPQAAEAFQKISATALAQGTSIDTLVSKFPEYKKQLQDQATALGVTVPDSAAVFADWMGGKVPDAIASAATANPKLAAQLNLTSTGLQKTQVSAEDAAKNLYTYASAMDAISASAGGAEDAIDAANASIKGGTHDQGTKQGRSNQAALDNVGSKSRESLTDLSVGGASQQALDAAAAHYKKKYREIAEDIGYSGKAARAFADDLIKTPKAVNVRIVTAGAKVSADQAAVLNHELQSIPKEQRARIVTIAETKGAKAAKNAIEQVKDKKVIARALGDLKGAKAVKKAMDDLRDRLVNAKSRGDTSGAHAVQAALDALHNKTVYAQVIKKTITTREERKSVLPHTGGRIHGGRLELRSDGGSVWGEGTATSDSIPAMLSNGEVVIKTKSAESFGYDRLLHINATGEDRGYAGGGFVGMASGGKVDDSVVKLVGLQQAVDNARTLAELTKALKAQEKATKKLSDTQTSATQAVTSLSTSLREGYTSKTNDADDLLEEMKQGASDLSKFATDLKSLGGLGLSKGVLDQITAKGAAAGGLDLAEGILTGGKSMVSALNAANASLDKASTSAALAAQGVKVKGHAIGGLVDGVGTGTSDSNLRALSRGEFVVREAVARSNLPLLQALNAGHQVPAYAHATIPATSFGGSSHHVDNSYHEGPTTVTTADAEIERALRRRDQRKRDSFALRGLNRAMS